MKKDGMSQAVLDANKRIPLYYIWVRCASVKQHLTSVYYTGRTTNYLELALSVGWSVNDLSELYKCSRVQQILENILNDRVILEEVTITLAWILLQSTNISALIAANRCSQHSSLHQQNNALQNTRNNEVMSHGTMMSAIFNKIIVDIPLTGPQRNKWNVMLRKVQSLGWYTELKSC